MSRSLFNVLIFANKIVFFSFQDKVILGTDYPFPLGEQEPGKLIESMGEFDEETKVCALNISLLAQLNRETTILYLPTTLSSEIASLLKQKP